MSTGYDGQGWGQAAVADVYGDTLPGLDDYDSEGVEVSQGGGLIEVEGAYHLEIADAQIDEALNRNNRQQITVRLVTLQSVQGQSPAGAAMWHHIELPSLEDKNQTSKNGTQLWKLVMASTCEFLASVGLFAKVKGADGQDKYIDRATNSTKLQFSTIPQRLKGLQVIGRPKRREYEKKDGSKGFTMEFPFGRGCSQLGDPQNFHVPLNVDAAAAFGFTRQAAPAAAPGATAAAPANQQRKPAPPKAAPAPAPAAADDEFASL